MSKNRFNILITNDDGFEALGIRALKDALSSVGDVKLVAPAVEKSACGHSLTLSKPLHFIEFEEECYRLDDGTPSDCVFLALNKFYRDRKPDLVVSGINRGANMGEDITYSGTVGGAMEGVIQGVPSISISQVCNNRCDDVDKLGYRLAKEVIVEVAERIKRWGFPLDRRKLLNINVPPLSPKESKGVKITYSGERVYGNDASKHINPRGKEFFWIGLPRLDWERRDLKEGFMSDFDAVDRGFVSITPIHLNMTSYIDIERVKSWL
jgi:5'-nucleotidase